MLGINFLGSFLLEQIGCGDLGGGDDGLIVIDSEISTAIQLCTCTFFLGPALY